MYITKPTREALVKKFNLDPNFKIEYLPVLNVPVTFIGLDKKGREYWISRDRKTLYITK